jgi:hypothetical protein
MLRFATCDHARKNELIVRRRQSPFGSVSRRKRRAFKAAFAQAFSYMFNQL